MAKTLYKTQDLIQKGLSLRFQKPFRLHRIKIVTFITSLMSFYKTHLNWQFNNNKESWCIHRTNILTFLVNWPLSLMFVALWFNMKFSVYCRQGIKVNTLAVAIGYIILMAPIAGEIWRRTLPLVSFFLSLRYSVNAYSLSSLF